MGSGKGRQKRVQTRLTSASPVELYHNVGEAMYANVDEDAIDARVAAAVKAAASLSASEKKALLMKAVTMVDLTTLEGSDTPEKVRELCRKAKQPVPNDESIPTTAAVCIYPNLVKTAVEELGGTSIKVASVAGGFPHGQTPLNARVAEIEAAVADGADEIDVVYSRNLLLDGKEDEAEAEIRAMKAACGEAHLKVILETGELKDYGLIRRASFRAMRAGADFIKTSTGKTAVNATLPVTLVMLDTIKDYEQLTGKKVGMKPAGGIRTGEDALQYLTMVQKNMGDDWMTNELFRFGASSLLGNLVEDIQAKDEVAVSAGIASLVW